MLGGVGRYGVGGLGLRALSGSWQGLRWCSGRMNLSYLILGGDKLGIVGEIWVVGKMAI